MSSHDSVSARAHRGAARLRCVDLEPLLTDFLEGDLSPEVEAEALEHVASCPACDLYLAEYTETIELISEWGGEVLPAETTERILAAVFERLTDPETPPRRGRSDI